MASKTFWTRADGGVAIRVTWREGGSRHGTQRSEIFDDEALADRLGVAVELASHRCPPG